MARLTRSLPPHPTAVAAALLPLRGEPAAVSLGAVGDVDLSWVVLFVFSFLGAVAFLVSRRRR